MESEKQIEKGNAQQTSDRMRAALITECFSAHQGVEDDNMNVMCLEGQITEYSLALELALSFLHARFKADIRFIRRLSKITDLEIENSKLNNLSLIKNS